MIRVIASILLILSLQQGISQKSADVEAYIEQYAPLAVAEQLRTGVPAAVKLAQAIHESAAGKGDLALRSNNHFGIKCKTGWNGAKAFHNDDERGECFRAYDSVAFSFRDHSDFLRTGKRYASLFDLDPADYTGWANGLKQAGYATNPKYPALIIRLIETYELTLYTDQAIAKSRLMEEIKRRESEGTGWSQPSSSPQ